MLNTVINESLYLLLRTVTWPRTFGTKFQAQFLQPTADVLTDTHLISKTTCCFAINRLGKDLSHWPLASASNRKRSRLPPIALDVCVYVRMLKTCINARLDIHTCEKIIIHHLLTSKTQYIFLYITPVYPVFLYDRCLLCILTLPRKLWMTCVICIDAFSSFNYYRSS